MPVEYRVDASRAEAVLGKIWARYLTGEYPYNKADSMLPQKFAPASLPRGGEEEAWYWMVVCLWMRGGVNSTDSAKQLSQLYDYCAKRRGLNPFVPRQAARMSETQITSLLKKVGLGMHQSSPAWAENARRLMNVWNGSVLSIFDGVTSYEQAWPRLIQDSGNGFVGFQHKMACMILYFLMEAGLIKGFAFPPPVDFHLQRIAVATGIVRRSDNQPQIAYLETEFEDLQRRLRDLYFDYELRHNLDGNRFTDSLWILSRTLCRHNPGNRTLQMGTYQARKTPLTAYQPDWDRPTDLRAFQRSCGACPVRQDCDGNVPAGPRYRLGKLMLLSPRLEPPAEQPALETMELLF